MRKLLLASYQFRTGEATYNGTQLIAIQSKQGASDFDDVRGAERVFGAWFSRIYTESFLDSCRIFPAITETTIFPNVTASRVSDEPTELDEVFNNPAPYHLRKAGITTIQQCLELTDEQLLAFRGIGKMAIQRLRRNY